MTQKKKDNIIIYGSLLAAIICLFLAALDYYRDMTTKNTEEKIKEIIKNDEITPKKQLEKKEYVEIKGIDRDKVVQKYLDEISDLLLKDELITTDIIKTWDKYEVFDTTYEKTITKNYYLCNTKIRIQGKNTKVPKESNVVDMGEYQVLLLKAYILNSTNSNGYIVKKLEK